MRIKQRSTLQNISASAKKLYAKWQKQQHRPPNVIVVLFVLLLGVTFIGIARDAENYYGVKPFGFLSEIIAAVSGSGGLTKEIKSGILRGDYKIIDGYGRCQVVNPFSRKPVRLAADAGRASSQELQGKGGLNEGIFVKANPEEYSKFFDDNNLTMGYLVGMAMGPDDSGATINFVKDSVDAGLMPIVRLCYDGGDCQFKSTASITSFYTKINNELADSDYEYIGVVGPNEPGTGKEMIGFGYGPFDYKNLIDNTNTIAKNLQEYRVENGGNMYIAPAILNIGNSQEGDDAYNYLYGKSGAKIDPELYDYILGNAYNQNTSGGFRTADTWYTEQRFPGGKSVKSYIEDNDNLVMVFTEFGFMDGGVENLKPVYQKLCEDETVDGINFFRPFAELKPDQPAQNPPIAISDAKDMLDSCSELPKKPSARKAVWFNCDFDSCIYPEKKKASSVKSDAEPQPLCQAASTGDSTSQVSKANPEAKGAKLKVKCNGGACDVEAQKTIQVWLPIKSTGSVNPVNSAKLKSFTPACAEVAAQFHLDTYDALNQFAGKLTDKNGKEYPMPWLGSLINCMSELSKVDFAYSRSFEQIDSSAGSLTNSSKIETQVDSTTKTKPDGVTEKPLAQEITHDNPLYALVNGDSKLIPDEKAVCIKSGDNEQCFDASSLDILKSIRFYSPLATPNNYVAPALCQNTDMVYLKNKDDYLPGPEVVVGDFKKEYTGSRICYMYGRRDVDEAVKKEMSASPGVDGAACLVHPTQQVADGCAVYSNNICIKPRLVSCRSLIRNTEVAPGTYVPKCDFNTGKCLENLSQEAIDNCFIYNYNDNDQIYIINKDYAEIPKYTINDIYDALSMMYKKLEDELSMRNKKIVFKENIGWKSQVDSIIRDKNIDTNEKATQSAKSPIDVGPYLYSINSDPSCKNPDYIKFFDNKYVKSKGDPVKSEGQYYDWLGYLDIIQEWRMGYINEQSFTSEEAVTNPFYDGTPPPESIDPNPSGSNGKAPTPEPGTGKFEPVCTNPQETNALVATANELLQSVGQGFSGLYNRPLAGFNSKYWALDICPNNAEAPSNCSYPWTLRRDYSDMIWCAWLINETYRRVYPQVDTGVFKSSDWRNWGGVAVQRAEWSKYFGPLVNVNDAKISEVPLGSAIFFSCTGIHAHIAMVCGEKVDSNGNGTITTCETNAKSQHRDFAVANNKLVNAPEGGCIIDHFGFPPTNGNPQNNTQCVGPGVIKGTPPEEILKGEPNTSRKTILISGISSQYSSFPLLTCDQVEICKKYSTTDLQKRLVELGYDANKAKELAPELCPLPEKLPEGKSLTCITYASDNRFQDNLANELCRRGYSIEGQCKNKCVPTENGGSGVIVNSSDVTCPKKGGACLYGPNVVTHAGLNAEDLIMGNGAVVAPFPGKIIDAATGNIDQSTGKADYTRCGSKGVTAGGSILYEGQINGKTIKLLLFHVLVKDPKDFIGKVYDTGKQITRVVNKDEVKVSDCWTGEHLHLELVTESSTSLHHMGFIQYSSDTNIVNLLTGLGCASSSNSTHYDKTSCTPTGDITGFISTGSYVQEVEENSCMTEITPTGKGTAKNIIELIEQTSNKIGVPKEFIAAIMSKEAQGDFGNSIGSFIKNGTAKYTGNPYDIGYPDPHLNPDGSIFVDVVGPMQFLCSTFTAYGAPPGATDEQLKSAGLNCERATAGVGSRYGPVIDCVQSIGMNEKNGDILQRKYVGHALCAGAYNFALNLPNAPSIESIGIGKSTFNVTTNPYYRAARGYFCGNQSCGAGDGYANAIWGRTVVFAKYWDKIKSGDLGIDEIRHYCDTIPGLCD